MTTHDASDAATVNVAPALTCAFDLHNFVTVRRRIDAWGVEIGLSDFARYRFVLAVNEAMTNAIRHGGGTGDLRLWRGEPYVVCEVADQGPGIRQDASDGRHRPDPAADGGRGLWITRQICEEVDVRSGSSGTTVILRFRIDQPESSEAR